MHSLLKLSLLSGLVAGVALAAHADTISTFNLTNNACTGCTLPASGSAGTVTLDQPSNTTTGLSVTIALNPGYDFHSPPNQNSKQHWAFTFNNTSTTVSSGASSPFVYDGYSSSGYSQSGIGMFNYAYSLTGGPSNSGINNVTFTLFDNSGLSVSSFGSSFAVDLIQTFPSGNTATGNFGTTGSQPPPAVPEPSTLMFLGTGLIGMAGLVHRSRLWI